MNGRFAGGACLITTLALGVTALLVPDSPQPPIPTIGIAERVSDREHVFPELGETASPAIDVVAMSHIVLTAHSSRRAGLQHDLVAHLEAATQSPPPISTASQQAKIVEIIASNGVTIRTSALSYADPRGTRSSALSAIDSITADTPSPLPVPDDLVALRESTPATVHVSRDEVRCLATAIYFEARGESERGQRAVGQVIVNRVENAQYPSSICGVVYQNAHVRNGCQFSFACDGRPETISEPGAWRQAQRIAESVAVNQDRLPEVAGATHYHTTAVNPRWSSALDRLLQIGAHIFYRS